ncbi:MAG: class I SAM-dependent methyltransferase, partial [Planctomycetes bacterium]|nr:class I SAM-dependent methyltransferase [Planctomycetota bacterium]
MSLSIEIAERAIVPDSAIRWGIRRLLKKRLQRLHNQAQAADCPVSPAWLESMRLSPLALETEAANEQHYEVPAEFYALCLGEHRKYSSCYWDEGIKTISEAEARMLALTCDRACLEDGQKILELGCGWGSLSLWMASHYPQSEILAVSNSASQREYIMGEAKRRGVCNLVVETADMNDFATEQRFDRVVSVEMIEHMRNWEELLRRVNVWLLPSGRLFLHYFSHREFSYPFVDEQQNDWMARHFFTGGLMPSHDLVQRLAVPLEVEQSWAESGVHYAKTSEAWLSQIDANRADALRILQQAGYS